MDKNDEILIRKALCRDYRALQAMYDIARDLNDTNSRDALMKEINKGIAENKKLHMDYFPEEHVISLKDYNFDELAGL